MFTCTLSTQGQLVIPKELRARLHLHAGDELTIDVAPDGALIVRPRRLSAQEFLAFLKKLPRAEKVVSLEEMDNAIAAGAQETEW